MYIEVLGNPNSEVTDIEAVAKIAHAHGIPLVIDSTFATPYLVRPIEYGADIVIHSATKFIGGHGTTIGGVIIDAGKFDWKASGKFPQFTEPNESYHGISFVDAAGPAAFITRIRAILLRDTGATISPISSWIFIQGLETLSLRVERHVSLLANVADVKSLAIHPASTTHSELNEKELVEQGIKPNTIRLSIGTENIDDIIEDLDEAFKAISD